LRKNYIHKARIGCYEKGTIREPERVLTQSVREAALVMEVPQVLGFGAISLTRLEFLHLSEPYL
jgi:hypothetical protein